jgi:hypothetical protein
MSLAVLGASDLEDLIGRFDDPQLIGKGSLHVLSFEAIRDRSGPRWPMRRDTVREFIERLFHRYFPPADFLMRLDDVNFPVVQSTEAGFSAQARALKLMREVLQFFLGSSARADIRLSRVTRISPEGVETAPIEVSDADLVRAATLEWGPEPAGGEQVAAEASPAGPPPGPVSSVINAGGVARTPALPGDRSYEAIFVVEPVWGIRQRAVVSYMLRPLVFEQVEGRLVDANLSRASAGDLLKINLIVLAEAQRLFRDQGGHGRFALHVPIHQASLGTANGRQALLSALERFQPRASSCLLIVLTGLEAGAPNSRIVELTSVLARHSRAVVALAPDLECKVDRWRDAHLSGVAIDLNTLASASQALGVKRLSDFADRAHGVAPALIAYSAPNSAALLAAWSAGFTHVGGDHVVRKSTGALLPLRVDPIDLYRETA